MLSQQGYHVRSFPRGRLVLAAATRRPPDLILRDINMPEMSGLEVCERLKADAGLASIPVIFLSALDDTDHIVKAFRSGGFDYLTKPFDIEEAQVRIEMHLRLHSLRTKTERHNHDLEGMVAFEVREVAQAQMATIFALAKLADSRDVDTGKHLERVQVLCSALATQMSTYPAYSHTINEAYIHNIFHASPLHDIGKVAIPDTILLKPGKLTPDEYAVMKTHATHGARSPTNGWLPQPERNTSP